MHRTFLVLDPAENSYARSRFALLPIPYDATVSFQVGTRRGPEAIIAASEHLETYDEETGLEPVDAGVCVLPMLEQHVDGPAAMTAAIHAAAAPVVADGKFLIGLGGEHGVTPGLVRATAEKHEKLSVLQIDAHLDLRDSYQGSQWSHATAMRRCLDHVQTVVPVGIRNICREELDFMKARDIQPFMADRCVQSDDWIPAAVAALSDNVYVTIDVDGFDPAYAPGTGTPVPGGLDWYRVTRLLRAVAKERRIVGADIVEVMPVAGSAVTEFLAARLAYKIMAYTLAKEEGLL
ncbi:MAG TPA: agmatinase [Phycisphaerae bacterium]|nr:agmatinase [Phycisphaerae bacterium]